MYNRIPTPTFNRILLIGAILLAIQLIFFNGGLIFSLFFIGLIIYVGKKNYKKTFGKILFWLGITLLIIAVLSMVVIRIFIVVLFLFYFYKFYMAKKNPEHLKPAFFYEDREQTDAQMVSVEPLFLNQLFGDQETSEKAYEWHDINIHGGFGNRIIDLSNTVLPEQEAIISIRHLAGKIVIYVPYEVEVLIHHSSIVGRVFIFNQHHNRLINQALSYRTKDYYERSTKVRILTSIVTGDLEVKRI